MRFCICKPPAAEDAKWQIIGDICDAIEFDYEKFFCGAGTFTLIIPRNSIFADSVTENAFLIRMEGDPPYDGFIVKNILRENDALKITGYDLNGLLIDRITLYPQGKDAAVYAGSTEKIVKQCVEENLVSSTDTERNFPKLAVAENLDRGIADDAASPRLECVATVVDDILGAQNMGYRITPDFQTTGPGAVLLIFEVYEAVDRTQNQSENNRVTFSYGLGNVTGMKRETGVTADKNAFYCELDGGTVQQYYKGDTKAAKAEPVTYSAYERREEYLKLGCGLEELSVYAEHEIADRYGLTDSLEVEAGDPFDYKTLYNVGDIVTVYDRRQELTLESIISAASVKQTATEYTVKLTLGKSKPKLLDSYMKKGQATATTVRNSATSVGSLSALTDYEYISDISVKVNGVTYTIEKNNDGLISKISDSDGNELEPTITGAISDVGFQNAVFWAVAMARGLNKSKTPDTMPFMDGIFGYFPPENARLPELLWDNYIVGQSPITLVNTHGSTYSNGELNLNSGDYGRFQCNKPNIFYVIAKFRSKGANSAGGFLVAKRTTDANPMYQDLGLLGRDENYEYFIPFIYSYDVLVPSEPVTSHDYAVCCVAWTAQEGMKFYCNGKLLKTDSRATNPASGYSGYMYINTEHRYGQSYKITDNASYKFLAFGDTVDEIAIIKNSQWLMKKYGIKG